MRRHAIGIIALGLLAAAAALAIWPHEWADNVALLGALVRVGVVMVVLWLAYPDLQRLPGWIPAVVVVLLVILAFRPRWFLIALPIVIALAILRPRAPRSR